MDLKTEKGSVQRTWLSIAKDLSLIREFDARTENLLVALVIKNRIATFGFQLERKGVGHGFLQRHVVPLDVQAVAVLDEHKEVPASNSAFENGGGLNGGETAPFHRQDMVMCAIVTQ